MKNRITSLILSTILLLTLFFNVTPAKAIESNSKLQLDFKVTNIIKHPTKNILYATAKEERFLAEINLDTKEIRKLQFKNMPESLFYKDNTLYVGTLIKDHTADYEIENPGIITLVNTDTLKVIKEINTSISPYDLVVNKDNIIFVASGSGQHTNIISYSEKTGEELGASSTYMKASLFLPPKGDRIYSIEKGTSPVHFYRHDNNNGKLSNAASSPYHGDFEMNDRGAISPDGNFLFNFNGPVLFSNEETERDMRYINNLSESYTAISFNLPQNEFFIGKEDGTIFRYSYKDFTKTGEYKFTNKVKNLFSNGNTLIAHLVDKDNNEYIDTVDTKTFKSLSSKYNLKTQGEMAAPVYNEKKGEIYVLDRSFKKLYIYDRNRNKIKKEVTLPYYPSNACLSEDGQKLFIANNEKTPLVTVYNLENGAITHGGASYEYLDEVSYGYKRIFNNNNKLFIITGDTNRKLMILDDKSLNPLPISEENYMTTRFLGNLAFSKDGNYFYAAVETDWSRGAGNTGITKFKIENDLITKVDSYSTPWSSNEEEPLDMPIFLFEDEEKLVYMDKVFNINDLSQFKKTFIENTFAFNKPLTTSAGLHGITYINKGQYGKFPQELKITPAFFDKNGVLFLYDKNTLISLWPTTNDMNGDNNVDVLDIASLSTSYNGKYDDENYNYLYDLNSDKIIDIYDLVTLSKLI
ncbi:MAG: hypothetical protein ACRC2K_13460 [Clostridium sp.]